MKKWEGKRFFVIVIFIYISDLFSLRVGGDYDDAEEGRYIQVKFINFIYIYYILDITYCSGSTTVSEAKNLNKLAYLSPTHKIMSYLKSN